MTEKKAALIVVDLQEDFCPPNGALAVPEGRDIAPLINELCSLPFTIKIATRDFHPRDHCSFASQHEGAQPFTSQHTIQNPENPTETQTTTLWPDHCVQGTTGCELIPEFDHSKVDLIIDKGQDKRVESYSGFGPPFRAPKVAMSELDRTLKAHAITHVFVTGLAFGFCVMWTAMDAAEHGYATAVIEDATRGGISTPEQIREAKRRMGERGIRMVESTAGELDFLREGRA